MQPELTINKLPDTEIARWSKVHICTRICANGRCLYMRKPTTWQCANRLAHVKLVFVKYQKWLVFANVQIVCLAKRYFEVFFLIRIRGVPSGSKSGHPKLSPWITMFWPVLNVKINVTSSFFLYNLFAFKEKVKKTAKSRKNPEKKR